MTMVVLSLTDHPETPYFMTIYVAVGGSMFLVQMIASVIFVCLFISASTNLHNMVLKSILKCPMRFFDTTPTGRILNRFSRDLDEIDGRLPWTTEALVKNGSRIIIALVFVAVIFPWFLIAIIPLALLFYYLYCMFRKTNREMKRLDNTSRSPVFSHITASVQGLATLRAYKKTERFQDIFDRHVDRNSLPFFMFFLSSRWFSIRLDFLCVVISTITAIIAVVTAGSSVSPALAGLAIMYSLRVSDILRKILTNLSWALRPNYKQEFNVVVVAVAYMLIIFHAKLMYYGPKMLTQILKAHHSLSNHDFQPEIDPL